MLERGPRASRAGPEDNGSAMSAVSLLPLLAVLPLHLGALHAHEKLLVLVVAFGPFVVLGVVVAVLRRRDIAAEEAEQRGDSAGVN